MTLRLVFLLAAMLVLGAACDKKDEPTPTASPSAIESPASGESPSATPSPEPTNIPPPDVKLRTWRILPPAPPPAGLVLFIEKGCYACDGGPTSIERYVTRASGPPVIQTVDSPAGDRSGRIFFAGRGEIYLSVCDAGDCGGITDVSPDAHTTIFRSTDGGISWLSIAAYEKVARVVGITAAGVVIDRGHFDNDAAVQIVEYELLIGGAAIQSPANVVEVLAFEMGKKLVWVGADRRTLVRMDGSQFFALPPDYELGEHGTLYPTGIDPSNGTLALTWRGPGSPTGYHYTARIFKENLTDILVMPRPDSELHLTAVAFLSNTRAIGNIGLSADYLRTFAPVVGPSAGAGDYPQSTPALIDFEAGTIQPLEIYGPLFGEGYFFERNFIRSAAQGDWAIVKGAGDCLNVREKPSLSATVVGCFRDGVLLHDQREVRVAEGVTWVQVASPSGQLGYASAEFLGRQ